MKHINFIFAILLCMNSITRSSMQDTAKEEREHQPSSEAIRIITVLRQEVTHLNLKVEEQQALNTKIHEEMRVLNNRISEMSRILDQRSNDRDRNLTDVRRNLAATQRNLEAAENRRIAEENSRRVDDFFNNVRR